MLVAASHRFGDFALGSAFQPIFSYSHRRIVGHEALLRATDPNGRLVSPQAMFKSCRTTRDLDRLDHACRVLHARAFAEQCGPTEWLFLNVDASLFAAADARSAGRKMLEVAANAGLAPGRIVIEVLEGAVPNEPEFEDAVQELKDIGFLLALDDFGAGHSNFDRVFRLRPHIVKLDRTVICGAAQDETLRRVTTQMISLLHDCGALVLVEGVENAEEAFIALDADADFVQGYHFGRPRPSVTPLSEHSDAMTDVWRLCEARAGQDIRDYRDRVRPYTQALSLARELMLSGRPMQEACSTFLRLEDAEVCFLLDASGQQIGTNHFRSAPQGDNALRGLFAPLHDVNGACWSRRPYFRRAIAAPGQMQVTRPYLTMQSLRMCVTLSVSFEGPAGTLIVCGDMAWRATTSRPGFGATTIDATF